MKGGWGVNCVNWKHGWGVRSGGQGREASSEAPEGSGGREARRASGWGSRLEKLLGGLQVKVRQAGPPFHGWGASLSPGAQQA